MPSPTERTEPTSLTSASVPKLAIWSLMTLEISAARISMHLALHRLREGIQTGADRAINALRSNCYDEAAQKIRVNIG